MNLNFDNNWRRALLLTQETDRDIERPVSYVILDKNKLPCPITKFCSQFFYEYGFDYDSGGYIWPSNDSTSCQILAEKLNQTFPKCASIVDKAPIIIHNLNFKFDDDLENLNF